MATLTIRKLDEEVKRRLRIRAAEHGRSMEEKARRILSDVLGNPQQAPEEGLAQAIRRRFAPLGGVDLEIPPRGIVDHEAATVRLIWIARCAQRTVETAMATLTIRKLDEEVKRRLRIRAAEHGRSMEEEVRAILAEALQAARKGSGGRKVPEEDFVQGIRRIVEPLGGIDLDIPPRDMAERDPPSFD